MTASPPTVQASLQSLFVPDGICYGCGPMNARGLGLRSHVVDGDVVAVWQPQEHHAAFPGVLCGGVVGTLIDCHSAAALAQSVRVAEGAWPWTESPGWVTAAFSVRLHRPTPLHCPARLLARRVTLDGDEAVVAVELHSDDTLRATGEVSWSRLRPREKGLLTVTRPVTHVSATVAGHSAEEPALLIDTTHQRDLGDET